MLCFHGNCVATIARHSHAVLTCYTCRQYFTAVSSKHRFAVASGKRFFTAASGRARRNCRMLNIAQLHLASLLPCLAAALHVAARLGAGYVHGSVQRRDVKLDHP